MIADPDGWQPPPSTARVENRQGSRFPDGRPAQLPRSTAIVNLAAEIKRRWPVIRTVGIVTGYHRDQPHTRDLHEEGRAGDVMTRDVALGTEIADWLVSNAEALGVQLVIWRRTLWVTDLSRGARFSAYTGAEDHADHIHVEVSPSARGASESADLILPAALAESVDMGLDAVRALPQGVVIAGTVSLVALALLILYLVWRHRRAGKVL